jgi:hypothetical protein
MMTLNKWRKKLDDLFWDRFLQELDVFFLGQKQWGFRAWESGFLKFVSIFGQKLRHLFFFKKKVMYRDCSTLQCDYNALCFTGFDRVLREQLEVQIPASSDVGISHFELYY